VTEDQPICYTDQNPTKDNCMPDENRIEHVNSPHPKPGEGGWTPGKLAPVIGACVSGGLTGVGVALATPGADWKHFLGAFLTGCGAGLAGFFGIKSAGPRKI
jgi:hypothetical protein